MMVFMKKASWKFTELMSIGHHVALNVTPLFHTVNKCDFTELDTYLCDPFAIEENLLEVCRDAMAFIVEEAHSHRVVATKTEIAAYGRDYLVGTQNIAATQLVYGNGEGCRVGTVGPGVWIIVFLLYRVKWEAILIIHSVYSRKFY